MVLGQTSATAQAFPMVADTIRHPIIPSARVTLAGRLTPLAAIAEELAMEAAATEGAATEGAAATNDALQGAAGYADAVRVFRSILL
jgi:hypothetical protein